MASYELGPASRSRKSLTASVIRLSIRETAPVQTQNKALMFKLIRAAFGERRKTLVNAIANSPELTITKAEAGEAIREAGLPPDIRGEKLDLAAYAALADRLRLTS